MVSNLKENIISDFYVKKPKNGLYFLEKSVNINDKKLK